MHKHNNLTNLSLQLHSKFASLVTHNETMRVIQGKIYTIPTVIATFYENLS